MSDQYGGGPAGEPPREQDRPGPYQGRGVFGSAGQQPGALDPFGGPAPYSGSFGQQPSPYSYQAGPVPPPRQVAVAAAISLGLGSLCVLLGLLALTSAGEQIAETLTGSKDTQSLVVGVILVCAVAYILPAIFLRKRRRWARIMLIVVAGFGVAGGVTALPSSILGLALHVTLLVLMFQQPTKTWFHR